MLRSVNSGWDRGARESSSAHIDSPASDFWSDFQEAWEFLREDLLAIFTNVAIWATVLLARRGRAVNGYGTSNHPLIGITEGFRCVFCLEAILFRL